MVFFTCNGCGSSLKKNQVEKHRQFQCRNSQHVSCMDCSKDFYGEEYQLHIKCISEEEKYSAKGWTPRPNQNKNEQKQIEWVSMVQNIVTSQKNIEPHLKQLLQTVSQHDNIPRKKPKFINFLKNIMHNRLNLPVAEKAWELIANALEEQRATKMSDDQKHDKMNGNSNKRPRDVDNDDLLAENGKQKKKKDDALEEMNGNTIENMMGSEKPLNSDIEKPESQLNGSKVKWSSIGKIILRADEDRELPLKKFKKKIIAEYCSRIGDNVGDKSVEELWSNCLKKLSKNPKFRVHKDKIKLVS